MFEDKETRLVEFVRQYIVDFINADSDDERYTNFEKIFYIGIEYLNKGIERDIENIDKRKLDDKEIQHIQSIVLKMLRIVLIKDEFKKLYPEAEKMEVVDETELERYIHSLFAREESSVAYRWRGRGETYINPNFIKWDSDIYKRSEYIIMQVLFDLFESQSYLEEVKPVEAIGYQYFSFCPKCGKFFYKKRKDQVYCSEKCRSADGTRRFRKSQTSK